MSLIAFINKKTFEIKDELEEYIYCDYEIRNVIAILNKKGYRTDQDGSIMFKIKNNKLYVEICKL